MMAPVLVPAIKSKWSARGRSSRFSISAAKAAVNAPRIPPPSKLRMRNGWRAPLVILSLIQFVFFLIADGCVLHRLDAAAEPDAQDTPCLVKKQPLRDPGEDRVRQGHVGSPLAGAWQVQTQ